MIKVFLTEDYDVLRESLVALLEKFEEIEVVGSGDNGQTAIDACENGNVDVILMDIEMPVMNGIEASKYIKLHFPAVKIIMLTMHNEYDHIRPALDTGVDGYLLKNTDHHELLKALRIVNQGGNYYTPASKETLFDGAKQKLTARQILENASLTSREIEIVKLVAGGLSTEEIGDKLDVSPHTVSSHRKNIYRKTGCKSPVDITRFAYESGLLNPGETIS